MKYFDGGEYNDEEFVSCEYRENESVSVARSCDGNFRRDRWLGLGFLRVG